MSANKPEVFNNPLALDPTCLNLSINRTISDDDGDLGSGNTTYVEEKAIFAEIFFTLYCIVTTCLLITAIVYILTWRKQTLNGLVILGFSVSNFVSYLIWTVSLGKWLYQKKISCGQYQVRPVLIGTTFCNVAGAGSLFSGFSALTWMTVLNFHICSTIRSMKPSPKGPAMLINRKRFGIFCIVSYGVPTAVTIASLIMEHKMGRFDDQVIRRQYGYDPCGVDKYYLTVLVKSVYAIVLILKTIFASIVVKSLWDFKKGRKVLQQNRHNPDYKKEFAMYAKLIVLMDLTWIFEIIWSFNSNQNNSYSWYRVAQDIMYVLQGLCLFWVFVCKREIKDLLSQKYPFCDAGFKLVEEKLKNSKSKTPDVSADSRGCLENSSNEPAVAVFTTRLNVNSI